MEFTIENRNKIRVKVKVTDKTCVDTKCVYTYINKPNQIVLPDLDLVRLLRVKQFLQSLYNLLILHFYLPRLQQFTYTK